MPFNRLMCTCIFFVIELIIYFPHSLTVSCRRSMPYYYSKLMCFFQPSHDEHHEPSSETAINTPVVTSERGRIRTRQPQQQTTQPTVHSYGPSSTAPVHIASVTTPRDAPTVRPAYQTSRENGRSPQIKTIRSAEAVRTPKSCREAPSIPTFDEDSYLSGNITIVSGSVNNPRQYKGNRWLYVYVNSFVTCALFTVQTNKYIV